MTEESTSQASGTVRAVFISYASEDLAAAERLCAALRAAGADVWFDKSALRGGDVWDESIRKQIRSCALFIPVISASAHARVEGYFRLEWKLAIDRSHLISSDQAFLLPVVIDGTRKIDERIPERFRDLQWSSAPGGEPSAALVDHVLGLLAPAVVHEIPPRPAHAYAAGGAAPGKSSTVGRWSTRRSLVLITAVALIGAAYYAAVRLMRSERIATPSPAVSSVPTAPAGPPAKPRIAVLPFDNLSPDPSNAFFTDGVHEEVLATLANHASGLEVISNTTMNSYKGRPVAVQTLARELNCNYVLEGSVRREGHAVRVTLQLIDARNDSHVWAQNYDRKLESAMALETEIAAAVSAQLSLRFADAMPAATSTSSPMAYDLYLKARAAESNAMHTDSSEGLRDAVHMLDQAIEIDPNFARARLQRMDLHVRLFLYNYASADEMLALAHGDLQAAQRQAPSDPLVAGWAAVLAYAEMDYERALELFDRAETAGLADPEILDWKQHLLFAMGRYPQAVALGRRLAELDPRNEAAQHRWFYMLMELHQYPEALRLAETGKLRGRDPGGWQDARTEVSFFAGGNLEPRRALYSQALSKPWHTAQDLQDHIGDAFFEFFLEHRFADLRKLIDDVPQVDDWNCTYLDWTLFRVGLMPVADIRGWTDLLLGDKEQMRHDGERILVFLQRHPETKWNHWFHLMLRADAQLFLGDGEAANRTAAEAVALTKSKPDVSDQMNAYVWSTHILAWTGAKSEAVTRLVELSTAVPGLWPGEITGNPIFSFALEPLSGYKALSAKLTQQMQASQIK